jgi:mRNA-degrading endonuclease RelE of RelBE toxin-antitoxin system
MKYNIAPLPYFNKQLKRLEKKYPSILNDVLKLEETLETDPTQGDRISEECYKIRMAIGSKNKGKSGGARVVTCVKIVEETVYLVTIYDKSEQSNLANHTLQDILEAYDLLPDDGEA